MSVTTTERAALGYGLGEEEGEAFWLFGMLETIKIGAEDTGGEYGARSAPGSRSRGVSPRRGYGRSGRFLDSQRQGRTSQTQAVASEQLAVA